MIISALRNTVQPTINACLRNGRDRAYAKIGKIGRGGGLNIHSGGCGFFGDVFIALNGIRYAEQQGMASRIDWGTKSLYFDSEYGPNAWSYFFEKNSFDFRAKQDKAPLSWLPYSPGASDFVRYDGKTTRRSVNRMLDRHIRPQACLLYTSPSPRDQRGSRMPSSA